jgi:HAD superfamily hydrolase (TIGR01490 family)
MPQPAAFFDMDLTLLAINSGREWIRFLRRRGEMSFFEMLRALGWIAQYRLAILDIDAITTKTVGDMRGDPEQEMIDKCRIFFDEIVAPSITRAGFDAIARHRRDGHAIALLSGGTQYITELVAARLEIDHVLCNRLSVTDGAFDGTYRKPVCYGHGKVHYAEAFAQERGVDLDESFFYTDSFTDLPMLERVKHRRVVNPDARLLRHARKRGWSIETWR